MRIERTAITLRRREPWEAIDLGFAMLRQWWQPVYAIAAGIVAVVALAWLATRIEYAPETEEIGYSDQLRKRPHTELLHDIVAVNLHGDFADSHPRSSLFVH